MGQRKEGREGKVVNCKYENYDVYIGRGSIWGNPYKIGVDGNRKDVIFMCEKYIRSNHQLLKRINELEGKILGCHCKPKACHGDIYIKILNERKYNVWFE